MVAADAEKVIVSFAQRLLYFFRKAKMNTLRRNLEELEDEPTGYAECVELCGEPHDQNGEVRLLISLQISLATIAVTYLLIGTSA
jgi:hypothetical protein